MDYQSLLFIIGDHLPAGSAPPISIRSTTVLEAQEQRLGDGLKLPDSLKKFLLELGPGEFRFGTVFSPIAQDGSSELDQKLKEFRESQVAERRRALRRYESELVPFAQSHLGTVYLFNLLDQAKPDRLWTWESESPDDEPAVTSETFWDFLSKLYEVELNGLAATRHLFRMAIEEHQVVEASYRHQPTRVLHPREMLLDQADEVLVLALQVGGYHESEEHSDSPDGDWRTFHPALLSKLRTVGEFKFTEDQLARYAAWRKRHPHLRPEPAHHA